MVGGSLYLGYRFDKFFGTFPWLMLTGAGLGIVLGLVSFVVRFVKKS